MINISNENLSTRKFISLLYVTMNVCSKIFFCKVTIFLKIIEIREEFETFNTFQAGFTLSNAAIKYSKIIAILSRDAIASEQISSKLKIIPLKDLIERMNEFTGIG